MTMKNSLNSVVPPPPMVTCKNIKYIKSSSYKMLLNKLTKSDFFYPSIFFLPGILDCQHLVLVNASLYVEQ